MTRRERSRPHRTPPQGPSPQRLTSVGSTFACPRSCEALLVSAEAIDPRSTYSHYLSHGGPEAVVNMFKAVLSPSPAVVDGTPRVIFRCWHRRFTRTRRERVGRGYSPTLRTVKEWHRTLVDHCKPGVRRRTSLLRSSNRLGQG